MDVDLDHIERRRMLRLLGGAAGMLVGMSLLAGPAVAGRLPLERVAEPAALDLALAIETLGGRYYAAAAVGKGTGVRTAFSDPLLKRHAADLAVAKLSHAAMLRERLGSVAAPSAPVRFAVLADSAFSRAARAAGMIGVDEAFDPFADDASFLLGAFLIEDSGAAGYRALIPQLAGSAREVASVLLADAIYHGGIVRTLLHERTATDPALGRAVAGFGAFHAMLSQDALPSSGSIRALRDDRGHVVPYRRAADPAWRIISAHHV